MITYPTWKRETDEQDAAALKWRKHRPEGFYWVEVDKGDGWYPAQWLPNDECWMVAGYADDMDEDQLHAIDERSLAYAQLGLAPAKLALSFADTLLTMLFDRRSAIVSSSVCSELEIADAQARGDFHVDRHGHGFVLRLKAWLDRVQERDGYLQPPPAKPEEQEGTL